jgi:hypothetical protein
MICHIFRWNLPICRTAMRRKTRASTITGIYVLPGSHSQKMSVGFFVHVFIRKKDRNREGNLKEKCARFSRAP